MTRASCGHLLWFLANEPVPRGGWVNCPYHPIAGVGETTRIDAVPKDAYRGQLLADPYAHLPTALRPVPAQQPADIVSKTQGAHGFARRVDGGGI